MNIKIFKDFLSNYAQIGEDLMREVLLRTKEVRVEKSTYLLFPGEVSKYSYFIVEGFFRSFIQQAEQEKTMGFFGPGQMCLGRQSYFQQLKTDEGIICEKDAVVFKISYHDWRALENISSEFLVLTKNLIIHDLLKITEINQIIKCSSRVNQYLFLKNQHPGISNIVSQRNIASYLGISEPTMSGIVKSLLFKPK